MGKKGKAHTTKGSIQFLNRMSEKFDWDNDEVVTIQVVWSDSEKVQRDQVVPAEIPGIEIKNNYKAVPGPAIKLEAKPKSLWTSESWRL